MSLEEIEPQKTVPIVEQLPVVPKKELSLSPERRFLLHKLLLIEQAMANIQLDPRWDKDPRYVARMKELQEEHEKILKEIKALKEK